MIRVKEYLISRIDGCCAMPLKDFVWFVDNVVYLNNNAKDNIKLEIQVKPNLTRIGWNYFLNSVEFVENQVRTKNQFLEVVRSGRIDCSFLKDIINSVKIGVSVLELPVTEKTIIRNFIIDCESGKLPEFMIKNEYTNNDGLIRSDMIEGLDLFDVVDVNETSLEDFLNNALAYDYNDSDLIVLSDDPDAESQSENMFFFVGGDKLDPNNYRPVKLGRIPTSSVIGLDDILKSKLDVDGLNLREISEILSPVKGEFAKDRNGIPHYYDGVKWIPFGGANSSSVVAVTNRIKNSKMNVDGIADGWTLLSKESTVESIVGTHELSIKKGFKVSIPFENIYHYTANSYWYLTFRSRNLSYVFTYEESALKISAVRSSQPNNKITPIIHEITRLDDLIVVKLMFGQNSAFKYADSLIFEIDEKTELMKEEDVLNVGFFQFNELKPSLFEDTSGISNGVKMTGSFQNGTLFNGIYE